MKKELHDLNERFYALYGRLYENSELLTREQSDYMAKKLLEQYKDEYELLELKESVERSRLMYALRLKRGYLSPRTWRFLLIIKRKYNFAAELLNREVNEEVQNLYAAQEAAIEKLHRQLMDEEVSGFSDDNEAWEEEEEAAGSSDEAEKNEEQSAEAAEPPGDGQAEECEAEPEEARGDEEQSEETAEPAGDGQAEESKAEPEEVRDDAEQSEEATEPAGDDQAEEGETKPEEVRDDAEPGEETEPDGGDPV